MVTAVAHPNIALIKYWGKQEKPGNLPATPSLSVTLDTLETTTQISEAAQDRFTINGEIRDDSKVSRFLNVLRRRFDIPPLIIDTRNNFPTGAGLASSASGFAALMTAINQLAELRLDAEYMSEWARMGSASSARSFFGGFVSLVPPLWRAQPAAPLNYWDLSIVVAVTDTGKKAVSSGEGMQRSSETSPFYNAWVRSSGDDYAVASDALSNKDFQALGQIAELSCLKMHSIMLTSSPTLPYWNAATLGCMDAVRALREDGAPVFFTIDAGPQVKAICEPENAKTVAAALSRVDGVIEVLSCGIGAGARVLD